jgi:excisionase family DNA binding protein
MSSGPVRRVRRVLTSVARTYSAQEIADHFGVAEKTVRRWIENGKLPAERDGRRFAVRLEDAQVVFAASRSGRVADRGHEVASTARRLEVELAELRGRYDEAQELIRRLELALTEERRRAAALEVRLEMRAAA